MDRGGPLLLLLIIILRERTPVKINDTMETCGTNSYLFNVFLQKRRSTVFVPSPTCGHGVVGTSESRPTKTSPWWTCRHTSSGHG